MKGASGLAGITPGSFLGVFQPFHAFFTLSGPVPHLSLVGTSVGSDLAVLEAGMCGTVPCSSGFGSSGLRAALAIVSTSLPISGILKYIPSLACFFDDVNFELCTPGLHVVSKEGPEFSQESIMFS